MNQNRPKSSRRKTFKDRPKRKNSHHSSKIYTGDASKIAKGLKKGLFAATDIERGEVIFVAKGKPVDMVVSSKKQSTSLPNAIGIKRNSWLDPYPKNPLVYLNHSCDPNAGIKGSVTFVALRKIKKNEHITFDYSISECDELWTLDSQCKCKAKNCRKVIRSIQSLPVTIYKRYLPYIPKAFQREYQKAHPQLKL